MGVSEIEYAPYIKSMVLVRVQKAIPRIIDIKKLISNSQKQV